MGLLEVAVLLAWVAIVLAIWAIVQVVAQHGRLLLRIEALERNLGDLTAELLDRRATDAGVDADQETGAGAEDGGAGEAGVPVGTVLHDFELPDLAGRQHLRSHWQGQRLLMIFVSPRCQHSRGLLANLAALPAAPPPAGPTPLVVSTGSFEENRRLVTETGLSCTLLVQEEMEVGALFEVPATPMAYLVDEDGRTASPLATGKIAILGLAASSDADGGAATLLASPSPELLHATTTPAPVNGARYQGGLDVGSAAPGFELPRLDGGTVTLDRLRGRRVLLVFTDLLCPSCDEIAPRLEASRRSGSGPAVVLIARGDLEANRAWAVRHGLTMPIGIQRRWDVSREYGLLAAPIAFLVDERGIIVAPVAIGADAIADLYTRASLQHHAGM